MVEATTTTTTAPPVTNVSSALPGVNARITIAEPVWAAQETAAKLQEAFLHRIQCKFAEAETILADVMAAEVGDSEEAKLGFKAVWLES